MLAVEGLVEEAPLLGALVGVTLLALAWITWVVSPRFGQQLRRIPGFSGRRSATLFLVAIGALTLVLSIVEAAR